jgi:hypothetical protein
MIDQLRPFQWTMNASAEFGPAALEPTAKQLVVVGQAISSRTDLGMFGRNAIDHAPARFRAAIALPLERPTAKQLLVEGHETSFHMVFEAPAGFGVGAIDHAGSATAAPAVKASAATRTAVTTAAVLAFPKRIIGTALAYHRDSRAARGREREALE